jgi:hypothetical protein
MGKSRFLVVVLFTLYFSVFWCVRDQNPRVISVNYLDYHFQGIQIMIPVKKTVFPEGTKFQATPWQKFVGPVNFIFDLGQKKQ